MYGRAFSTGTGRPATPEAGVIAGDATVAAAVATAAATYTNRTRNADLTRKADLTRITCRTHETGRTRKREPRVHVRGTRGSTRSKRGPDRRGTSPEGACHPRHRNNRTRARVYSQEALYLTHDERED
ncbi:hypothetical protein GCM10010149_80450 [Nonomuraea roseoviolacea subsp. roseoviolacea]